MLRDLFDIFSGIFAIIIFSAFTVAAILFGLAALAYYQDKYICEANALEMGLEHNHTFWGGCKVKTSDGQLLPYRSVVPVLKDGKTVFVPKPQPRPEAVVIQE